MFYFIRNLPNQCWTVHAQSGVPLFVAMSGSCRCRCIPALRLARVDLPVTDKFTRILIFVVVVERVVLLTATSDSKIS